MGVNDVASNGEAEAGAASFAGSRGIHTIEAFENALLIGERDADAGVGDGDDGFAGRGRGANVDAAAGGSVLDGIVEQVLQDFVKEAGVAAEGGQRWGNINFKSDLLAAGFEEGGLGAAFDEFGDADGSKFELELAGFDARELEKIVGETIEAGGVVANDFEETAIILRIVEGAGEQSFGEAADGGERRLEFVRDVGDEILADALEATEFGDVVEDDDGARGSDISVGGTRAFRICRSGGFDGTHGGGGDGKTAGLDDAGGNVGAQTILPLQGAADEAEKFRIANDFDDGAALIGGGIHTENVEKGLIAKDEILLGVNDGDAFCHAAKNGVGLGALAAEGANGVVEVAGGFVERIGEIGELVAGAFGVD